MINGKEVLAIVPARGGSKGIPLKNIANCGGKPLIAWTMEAARRSKYVDTVVISSDEVLISRTALAFHPDAIWLRRPAELATDETKMEAVIDDVIGQLPSGPFAFCVLLQPTSPLRTTEDIDASLELLVCRAAATVTSVHESYAVPFTGMDPPRRQDRKPTLMLNGAIYAFDVERFMQTHRLIDEETLPYVMPAERAVDVDYPLDLALAGLLIGSRA